MTKAAAALAWITERAEPQTEMSGTLIPESGIFTGSLPYHMAETIRTHAMSLKTLYRDGQKSSVINFQEGGKFWSVTYGSHKSTQNRLTVQWLPSWYCTEPADWTEQPSEEAMSFLREQGLI